MVAIRTHAIRPITARNTSSAMSIGIGHPIKRSFRRAQLVCILLNSPRLPCRSAPAFPVRSVGLRPRPFHEHAQEAGSQALGGTNLSSRDQTVGLVRREGTGRVGRDVTLEAADGCAGQRPEDPVRRPLVIVQAMERLLDLPSVGV